MHHRDRRRESFARPRLQTRAPLRPDVHCKQSSQTCGPATAARTNHPSDRLPVSQSLLTSNWLCPKRLISLCNLCVLCVCVVVFYAQLLNHRGTEDTEI